MLRAFNNRRRWIKETSSRACSGTLGCMDTSFTRHPGLVPGPWLGPGKKSRHPGLAPGSTQKGRDLKTTHLHHFDF